MVVKRKKNDGKSESKSQSKSKSSSGILPPSPLNPSGGSGTIPVPSSSIIGRLQRVQQHQVDQVDQEPHMSATGEVPAFASIPFPFPGQQSPTSQPTVMRPTVPSPDLTGTMDDDDDDLEMPPVSLGNNSIVEHVSVVDEDKSSQRMDIDDEE